MTVPLPAYALVIGISVACGCAQEVESPQASPTIAQADVAVIAGDDSANRAPPPVTSSSEPSDPRHTESKNSPVLLGPYGTLDWSDTLLSALSKVRQIDGATEVELLLLHRNLPAAQFDGPEKLQAWMKSLFGETMTYRTEFLHNDPVFSRPVYDIGVKREAKSLSLVGVDYNFRVTFTSEKGLVVSDPKQVRRQSAEFFGEESTDDVSLVLSEVELYPIGAVSPDAHREIIDLLMEKYGPLHVEKKYALDFDQVYLNLTFRDKTGNSLDLYPGGKLMYRNGLVHGEHKLSDVYNEHRMQVEEGRRKERAKSQPGARNDL